MDDRAHITIRRVTNYADRLRAYKVVVDGVTLGALRAGQSVTVPVLPGRHRLKLRIDWCGSREHEFEAQAGEQLSFECGSSLAGWRIFLALPYILFRTNEYLWLRPTERPLSKAIEV